MENERRVSTSWAKAQESLDGAESELAHGRHNNCANRAYYACFHAAVAALQLNGIPAAGTSGRWSHEAIQAQFVGKLINRRKRYSAELRTTFGTLVTLRQVADYEPTQVTATQAQRAVRRATLFVRSIEQTEGASR